MGHMKQTGGGKGWAIDMETGQAVMPEIQSEFLDWLLSDPKDPATLDEWCFDHQVDRRTTSRWKRDKRFQRVWEERAREKNISVDRVQDVVDSLHRSAVSGDVKAASLYLQYIDRFTPKKRVVVDEGSVRELSDEELVQRLRADLDLFG